jgi:prophage regulatory protein
MLTSESSVDPTTRPVRILRLAEVRLRTGLSTSSIYNRARDGSFPKQIPLGANSIGWLESEITAWLAARIAERDLPRSHPLQEVAAKRRAAAR